MSNGMVTNLARSVVAINRNGLVQVRMCCFALCDGQCASSYSTRVLATSRPCVMLGKDAGCKSHELTVIQARELQRLFAGCNHHLESVAADTLVGHLILSKKDR